MVKQDYRTGRHYLEKDERLIPLPLWMRKYLNGAEYYLHRVNNSQRKQGDD